MIEVLVAFALFPFALIGLLLSIAFGVGLLGFAFCAFMAIGFWVKENLGTFGFLIFLAVPTAIAIWVIW